MEPLETLHKGLSQSFCLCHLETRTILEQLDLGSVVTGQGTVEKSARDQVLVTLSLLTHLGESNHCRKVREVQGTLFTSGRLEHMVSLMSSTDQLVAYSARKCLEVLVLNLAPEDPSRIACLLRKAIMSVLRADGDWDGGETVSVMNRAIYTLDLLTSILRGRSTGSEDTHRGQTTLPCAATSASVKEERRRSLAPSLEDHSCDFIDVCCGLSKETTLEFCAVFSSPPAAYSHQCESATKRQRTLKSWVHSLDTSSRHKICHAFLRLLYSYAKVEIKRENTCKLSFVLATLPHLQAMLMTYCHGSGANLKMVFSVLILFLTACMNICETAKRGGESEVDGGLKQKLTASWRRLVADICKGEWLENMPYHKGLVGFGGVAFTLEQTSKEEEYGEGDRVVLRKLAHLVILSTELEAASSGMVSLQGCRHLDRVSHFVVSKLRGMSWCEMEMLSRGSWIFEIFGDQDDALVGMMLNLLKISLSARTQHDKETSSSSNSGFTRIDEHISHHDDEIAAGKHTSYILDAHHVFVSFLDHMTWDHSILLDLLISAETDFIEYFMRYLRLVATDWERFVQVQGICRRKKEELTVAHVDSSGGSVEDDDDDDDDDNDDDGDESDKICVTDDHDGKDFNEVMHNAGDNFNHDNDDENDSEDDDENDSEDDDDDSDEDGQVPDNDGREFSKAMDNTGNSFNYDNGDDNDDEDDGDSDEDSEVSDSNYCDSRDFNEKFIDKAGDNFSCDNGVTNDSVGRKEKLFGAAADSQEFCGQAKTVGVESSEGVPKKKRKISLEGIQEDICSKHKSTEKLPLGNVVEACDLYKEPNGENEPNKEEASKMGCMDDTMTILIRLRLAVERLENKGLFPFSPSPLIRLLTQVEDLYESSD